MLKNSVKKAFAILFVVFVVALPFTACSKGKKDGSGKEDIPEYVYEAKFDELGTIGIDYVNQSLIKDGIIYMTGSHYEYNEKADSSKSSSYLLTSDIDNPKLEMSEFKGLKENESPDKLFLDENGKIIVLSYFYDYNKKTGAGSTKYYLSELNKKGKLSGHKEIKPGVKKNEEFYMGSSTIYSDGKLITSSDSNIYIFNKDGSLHKKFETDNYIDNIFAANGKIYVMTMMSDVNGTSICELDMKTGKLGKPLDFGGLTVYNIMRVNQDKDGIMYFSNSDGLYKYDLDKNKAELLFNWLNVDIDGNNISNFYIMEDGNLIVLNASQNYDESGKGGNTSTIELATIDKKKYSESKQKKRLTLAANYISEDIRQQILKYNKTNEDYHIEIKTYNTYEDPQKQMNLDIISGIVPDIIELNGLSKDTYVKKGLLTDLYPFMEKDNEVQKEDFVDSILSVNEHDGELYYMPTSFSIAAMVGSKKMFGDMEGWTYEEMEEKYKELPKGGTFMEGMTSEWFIQNMISSQMKDFINFETGEVNLDSDEFIHMLEFSKNFQTSDEYIKEQEENGWKSEEDIYKLVKSGKLLLRNMYLYDFSDIQVNEKLYKSQGGYTVISQPSKDKNNKLAMGAGDACLAISEKCDDKEGAWRFLRNLYTYEYQKKAFKYNGFPVRKDALDKKIEYAMATKKYKDDDGTEVIPIQGDSYSFDSFTVELKPYTKEHMDLFRSMVDRIGKENSYDTFYNDITKMIDEETKAFFAGDKTAKEIAEILQSRVKIYVSENS